MTLNSSLNTSLRLFFALLPPEGVAKRLSQLAQKIQLQCGGRAVNQENIHLTLLFLGVCLPGAVSKIETLAPCIAVSSFELEVDEACYLGRRKIVWASASHVPQSLTRLVAELAETMRSMGIHFDDRRFLPHITLLRKADRPPKVQAIEPVVWSINDFALIESRRLHGAQIYRVVKQWQLRHLGD